MPSDYSNDEINQNLPTTDQESAGASFSDRAVDYAQYSAWRSAANAEWLGAIATSVSLSGANTPVRVAAAGTYGLATLFLENRQTDIAARKMARSHQERGTEPVSAPSILKDAVALAAAAYQGAGAGIEVNDSFGLPNTKTRRRVQAATYATFVSLWASPALTETGKFAWEQFSDNPARSAAITLLGSVASKFLIVDRIRSLTRRLHVEPEA